MGRSGDEVEGKRDLPLSPNPSYRWAAALGMEKSEQVLIKPDDFRAWEMGGGQLTQPDEEKTNYVIQVPPVLSYNLWIKEFIRKIWYPERKRCF